MADIEQNITLTAVGGDESAAEIGKTTTALNGVVGMSKTMESQFSHRFTHIGLQLFAGDLLRTSGLGGETRQILGVLQTGIMGAGAAFGAAAGPIMLVVSALLAVVAVGDRVINKHQEEAEALAKLVDTQEKSKAGYDTEIAALTAMQTAGVKLTGAQMDLLKADQAVSNDLKSGLLVNQAKEIEALEKQRSQLAEQQALHQQWVAAMALVTASLKQIEAATKQVLLPITKLASAIKSLAAEASNLVGPMQQNATLTGTYKQKYDELSASIAKAKVQSAQMATDSTADLTKMSEAAIKYRQDRETNELAMYKDMQQTRSTADSRERQSMDNRMNQWMQSNQDMTKEQAQELKKQEQQAKQVADRIGNDFSTMANKMIFEGKSFTQSFDEMARQMMEQFVSYVIRMIAQWIALRAVMGVASMGASEGAFAAMGADGGMMATGGTALVDKPTMFIAGEAGPEIASFSPAGAPNSGSDSEGNGGGNSQVNNVTVNVSGVIDNSMVNKIGQQIIQSIRGGGQLNFTRS